MVLFALYSIIGMTAAFIIPYYFPRTELVAASASYDFGFNNSVGILILFLVCLGLVVYSWLFRKDYNKNIFIKHNSDIDRVFKICMLIQIILCLVLWFIIRYANGMGESEVFISNIRETEAGRKLYTQTEFPYGALLLYIPYFLRKISGLSINDAYFLSWTFMQCIGFYWFYKIIIRFNIDSTIKKVIFITIFILTLPMNSGINYTFFRFITPYAILLFLQDKEDMSFPPIVHFIYLVLCNSLVVNISPEVGMVFSVTLFISYAVKYFLTKNKIHLLYSVTSLISCIIWFWLIDGMLSYLSSLVYGGLNWPFVFCYSLVLFFVSVFCMAVNIGSQLRDIRDNMNILTFELMACGMIYGALGRCDPGHIIWDGLMIFVIVAAILNNSKKLRKIYSIAMIIFCIHLIPTTIIYHLPGCISVAMDNPVIGKVLYSDFGQRAIITGAKMVGADKIFGITEERVRFRFKKGIGTGKVPEILKDISDVAMPFGGHSSISAYFIENEKYHFPKIGGVITSVETIRTNLEALKTEKPKYLLLPRYWDVVENYSSTESINFLFVTKYPVKQKYHSSNVYKQDTIDYIKDAYEFVCEVNYSRAMLLYRLK